MQRDVVVVGSGGGGLTAALAAAKAGMSVLVAEKSAFVGGTTALSGGVMWVPCNPLMQETGNPDDAGKAALYLRSVIGNRLRPEMVAAYLDHGPRMVDFIRRNSEVKLQTIAFTDYKPELPGAALGGRSIGAAPYDGRRLGNALDLIRPPLRFTTFAGTMMLDFVDIYHILRMRSSWPSFRHMLPLFATYARDMLTFQRRGRRLTSGNALVGGLLKSCLDAGVEIRTNCRATGLVVDGRVKGVELRQDGEAMQVRAGAGVLFASGGFANDPELRRRYFRNEARHPTMSTEGSTGDAYRMGVEAGAAVGQDLFQNFLGFPISVRRNRDGSTTNYMHVSGDRGKPGAICVTPQGRRFVNESMPYNDFGHAMLAAGIDEAFLICDHAYLREYGFGLLRPGPRWLRRPEPFIRDGYIVRGASLAELARQLGIDPATLERTVSAFNDGAREGRDPEFHRGESAYDRLVGDPAVKPSPNLRPLGAGPFYAIRIMVGDLGTWVGLKTNADAQVLGEDGRPIAGLYACGLDSSSIFSGTYPGGGSSIGPSMVMGYAAAMHMAATRAAGGS